MLYIFSHREEGRKKMGGKKQPTTTFFKKKNQVLGLRAQARPHRGEAAGRPPL